MEGYHRLVMGQTTLPLRHKGVMRYEPDDGARWKGHGVLLMPAKHLFNRDYPGYGGSHHAGDVHAAQLQYWVVGFHRFSKLFCLLSCTSIMCPACCTYIDTLYMRISLSISPRRRRVRVLVAVGQTLTYDVWRHVTFMVIVVSS